MSLALASITLSASTLAASPQPDCEARTPLQRRLEYQPVEVLAEGTVLFRICAPDATSVKVSASEIDGIPNGYDGKPAGLPMAKDAQGYWSATTPAKVASGTYRYMFNVNGIDMPDPQATRFSEDFRGVRSVFEIPGPATSFQSFDPAIPHGLVSTIEYRSATLGTIRRMHVYTPPGYEGADTRRYPVLYLIHGASSSDDSWTSAGHAQYILDNLIAGGRARPMIVVMPFGHTPDRPGVARMVNTDFGGDLHSSVIPYIDSHFRTIADVPHRAMAGLSMGGAHTLNFGLPRPDVFGPIGVFSVGIAKGKASSEYVERLSTQLTQRAKAGYPVFYAYGRDDILYDLAPPTRKILTDHGIAYTWHETGGGHTWQNWRDYLNVFVPKLFNDRELKNDARS